MPHSHPSHSYKIAKPTPKQPPLRGRQRGQSGQSLVEYLILVALMGVASIGIVRVMNHTVKGQFANITNSLQGKGKKASLERVKKSQYQKSDFNNFMQQSKSQ